MTPRNLGFAYHSTSEYLALQDVDCITATAGAVETWLLGCAALGTMTGMSYANESGVAYDSYYDEGYWLSRALVAYERTRPSITGSSRTTIDAWLVAQAQYMATMLDTQLQIFLPGRATDNYATLGAGADAQYGGAILYQGGPPIAVSAVLHNNRRAAMLLAVALAGLLFDNPAFKAEAKRYVKEWVRFAVFPGGEQGEWSRADNYGNACAGLTYGAETISVALEVAARYLAAGDRELAEHSTTLGANGTQVTSGPAKTIYTALTTHLDIIDAARSYVTPAGNAARWWDIWSGLRFQHWAWYLQPLNVLQSAGRVARYLRIDVPAGAAGDHFFPAWTGCAGIYADCRAGVPTASWRLA